MKKKLFWISVFLCTALQAQTESLGSICKEDLGGGIEPSFVTIMINDTNFHHNTYTEPTDFYHEYLQDGNTTATIVPGSTYDFYTFTSSEAIICIWMDYNRNNQFEENEYTEIVNNMVVQNTTTLVIPSSVTQGNINMRIRSRAFGSSMNAWDACTVFGSGETRDYILTIGCPAPILQIPSLTFCEAPTVGELYPMLDNLNWYTSNSSIDPLENLHVVASGLYYASRTIEGCEGPKTAVNISVINAIESPQITNQYFCFATTASQLYSLGTNLLWYSTSLGGVPLLENTTLSSGTYYVSQTIDVCERERIPVSVTISHTSLPIVTLLQNFCGTATVSDLSASGTNLRWYSSSLGGVPLPENTTLLTGTYYVSQTIDVCESERIPVGVTISHTSLPAITSLQNFCGTARVSDLSASGTNFRWYSSSLGGVPLPENTTLLAGIYYVSQTIDVCESERIPVNVSVSIVSAPSGAANQILENIGESDSKTLKDIFVNGEGVLWYETEEDITNKKSLPVNTILVTGNTYYATQTINGCESKTSIAITIILTLSIKDFQETMITYYPNPVLDYLNIVSKELISSVKIYNLLGQMIIKEEWNKNKGLISLKSLEEGNYILCIESVKGFKSFIITKISN